MLAGSIGEHGYKYYRLSKNGKKKMFYAHRLVAETYIENPNNLPVVNHKDGNKLNAQLDNLELIEKERHQSHHNKEKVLTESHKQKIAKANEKRKGMKIKKRVDMPNLQEYLKQGYSMYKIAKIYGCTWDTVKRRIYENEDLLKCENQ